LIFFNPLFLTGKTLEDDMTRPFQRPGSQPDNDNNNFNFDTENKDGNVPNNENTGNGRDESDKTNGNTGNAGDKHTGSTSQVTTLDDDESGRYSEETQERQKAVRDAYLHAWKNYERYAFGKDELQPPYQSGKDWLGMFHFLFF
jgi:hypothetical protein